MTNSVELDSSTTFYSEQENWQHNSLVKQSKICIVQDYYEQNGIYLYTSNNLSKFDPHVVYIYQPLFHSSEIGKVFYIL